jgi:hypothetical protein
MTKKRRLLPSTRIPAGYERPSQTPLPADLGLLGWQRTSDGRAERRDASGHITAFVDVERVRVDVDDRIIAWFGYSMIPMRETWEHCLTAVDAIRAAERAEAYGPLSDLWDGQPGAPQCDGWDHQVRQKRHVWTRRCDDNVPLVVAQKLVAPSWGLQPLSYVAAIGHQPIVGPDGKIRDYATAILAMESGERNAVRQGHPVSNVAVQQ